MMNESRRTFSSDDARPEPKRAPRSMVNRRAMAEREDKRGGGLREVGQIQITIVVVDGSAWPKTCFGLDYPSTEPGSISGW